MSAPDVTQNGGLPPDAQAVIAELQKVSDAVAATGPPVLQEDLGLVLDTLLRAVRVTADGAASSEDTREVREAGQSALAFAQAWVIMHPSVVSPSGIPVTTQMQLNDAQHPPPGPPPAPKEAGTTGRPPQPTARRTGQVKG